jgi:hypothetical protein
VLTPAGRLLGVEMQHPGLRKDVTVLWCKSAAERDVGALSSACANPLLTLLLQDMLAAINSFWRNMTHAKSSATSTESTIS